MVIVPVHEQLAGVVEARVEVERAYQAVRAGAPSLEQVVRHV